MITALGSFPQSLGLVNGLPLRREVACQIATAEGRFK
jgi:hypothetical protein